MGNKVYNDGFKVIYIPLWLDSNDEIRDIEIEVLLNIYIPLWLDSNNLHNMRMKFYILYLHSTMVRF